MRRAAFDDCADGPQARMMKGVVKVVIAETATATEYEELWAAPVSIPTPR